MKKVIYTWILLSVVGISACKTVAITGRKQLNLVTNTMIQSLAFSQYDSVVKVSKTLLQSDERAQLVTRVGNKIQQAVDRYMQQNNLSKEVQDFKWEYNTINEDISNAWCMPGGKVVVYTGLLPITESEAGLAVVMGHEIAHAVARHGNERMSEGLLVGFGGLILAEALKEKKQETQLLFLSLYLVGSKLALELPNNRMQESEADKLGLIFMAMAGYDPVEAVSFWQRMEAKTGNSEIPQFLSTHPSGETRIKNILNLIPEIKQKYFVTNEADVTRSTN